MLKLEKIDNEYILDFTLIGIYKNIICFFINKYKSY